LRVVVVEFLVDYSGELKAQEHHLCYENLKMAYLKYEEAI